MRGTPDHERVVKYTQFTTESLCVRIRETMGEERTGAMGEERIGVTEIGETGV